MKRVNRFSIACALAVLTLFAASCKKDQGAIDFTAELQTIGDDSKVHMEGLYPTWNTGDGVKINGNGYSVTVSGSGDGRTAYINDVSVTSGAVWAFYPAEWFGQWNTNTKNVTFTIPQFQPYETETVSGVAHQKVRMPMVAYRSSTSSSKADRILSFRNVGSLIKVVVTGAESTSAFVLNAITLKASSTSVHLYGTYKTNLTLTSPLTTNVVSGTGGSTVVLTGINKTISAGVKDSFYIVVPKTSTTSKFTIKLTTNRGEISSTTSGTLAALGINQIGRTTYSASITSEVLTSDITELSGHFTISSSQYVTFAKGNCKCIRNGSGWSWKTFAQQYQYRYHTSSSSVTLSAEENETSYFAWGQYGNEAMYAPTSGGTFGSSWTEYGDAYGTGWCCLTPDEWKYILEDRAVGSSGCKFLKAKVHDIKGLLLFPDDFSWPSGMSSPGTPLNNKSATSWTAYTDEQWGSLETAGCVFIPACYYVYGATLQSNEQYSGYYLNHSTSGYGFNFYATTGSGGVSYNRNGTNNRLPIRLCKKYSSAPSK